MAYATYEEYLTIYSGTLFTSEEQFRFFGERASDFLDVVTFDRLHREDCTEIYGDVWDKVKKCCCALAENLFYYDTKTNPDASASGGTKQSESIGKYSVTFSNPLDDLEALTGSTFRQLQRQTVMDALGNTGLLYRGCY